MTQKAECQKYLSICVSVDILMPRAVVLLDKVVILEAFTFQHRLATLDVWRYKPLHNRHINVTDFCWPLTNNVSTFDSNHSPKLYFF